MTPPTKRGLLLLNLGTPDGPEPEQVGRYLKQFLMDPWVVDIPWIFRWLLVNVAIVPKRKFASSHAYKSIWTKRGSPLLTHLEDLHEAVKPLLPEFETEIAMRYGNPSVQKGLSSLVAKGVSEILVFPLYPQYAESSTRSSMEECRDVAKKLNLETPISFVQDFYEHPAFIDAFCELIKVRWESEKPDHLLMSFHGLPERHVKRTDLSGGQHCLVKSDCCAKITEVNRFCYRAQSYATARAIAAQLGLQDDQYSVAFQSRLGRTPWIQPFTDEVFPQLTKKGVKTLAVVCPSFVSDCLETIEEIGDRGKEQFLEAGGSELVRVPCLNSEAKWASAVAQIAREN